LNFVLYSNPHSTQGCLLLCHKVVSSACVWRTKGKKKSVRRGGVSKLGCYMQGASVLCVRLSVLPLKSRVYQRQLVVVDFLFLWCTAPTIKYSAPPSGDPATQLVSRGQTAIRSKALEGRFRANARGHLSLSRDEESSVANRQRCWLGCCCYCR